MGITAVILAAGKGTRMKTDLPKVLHKVCGVSMLAHVVEAANKAYANKIIVVAGFGATLVEEEISNKAQMVYQKEQLGTAHALMQAGLALEEDDGDVLVLCGDTPLINFKALQELIKTHQENEAFATVLTALVDNPFGYGRIIRLADGTLSQIVEQKDATFEQEKIKEINTGIYCLKKKGLFKALASLGTNNAQKEYYLTDIIQKYSKEGKKVIAFKGALEKEILGVNDRCQLAKVERLMRESILEKHMLEGVSIIDPYATYIQKNVVIGKDSIIYPNTFISEGSIIGKNCVLGPNTDLIDVKMGSNVKARYSLIENSMISDNCTIGPYAYIRPGCELSKEVKVGDFVELKKTQVGKGTKIPHLSYVGDAILGEKINIGAGTITCNYDGKNKWPTVVADGAFIGSNTNLVAPVTIGKNAIIGAGSTITKDIPAEALGLTRDKQRVIDNWKKNKT